MTSAFRRKLNTTDALITTWDSPRFSEELTDFAPNLRIIAHCGGEVKSRFARPLFDQITITTAPVPMARATAEMGAALCSIALAIWIFIGTNSANDRTAFMKSCTCMDQLNLSSVVK